jgi:hypothetical protein
MRSVTRCRAVRSGTRSRRRGSIPVKRDSRMWPAARRRRSGRSRPRFWSRGIRPASSGGGVEASGAAISASTRVRRNSSGLHRCVFAVTSSPGASRRIAAIFNLSARRLGPPPARAGWTDRAALPPAGTVARAGGDRRGPPERAPVTAQPEPRLGSERTPYRRCAGRSVLFLRTPRRSPCRAAS